MATVYILYSSKGDKFYTGSCLEFDKRLAQHLDNSLGNSFTSRYDDWETYLRLDDLGYEQSRKVESHIKQMKSAVYIRNLRKYSSMQDKLITRYC